MSTKYTFGTRHTLQVAGRQGGSEVEQERLLPEVKGHFRARTLKPNRGEEAARHVFERRLGVIDNFAKNSFMIVLFLYNDEIKINIFLL